jgi:Na+-translocating ferredoxin:NAD+ oxidoreductase subunit C
LSGGAKKMSSVTDFLSPENGAFTTALDGFLPREVIIPLDQDEMRTDIPVVAPGDVVSEGQIIARSIQDPGSACIHASMPGKVVDIVPCQFPDGRQGQGVKITLAGAFSFLGRVKEKTDWKLYSAADLRIIFSEKGIVNTFSGCQPLSAQIDKAVNKKKLLIVRLFDEDPSRTSDSFVSVQYQESVLTGAAIIATAAGSSGILFIYDKAAALSDEVISMTVPAAVPHVKITTDARRYPAGFSRQILSTILKECTQLPFSEAGIHDLFIDAPTALSVYKAVVFGIPVVSRFVHITGDCLRAAAVMDVRIGTTLRDLVEQCGGFKKNPEKIIINGLISGTAVSSLDIPVSKQVKSVTFLPVKDVPDQRFLTCVRCGQCRRICPAGLHPDVLYRTFSQHQDAEENPYAATALLCSGCALCNSVCPARLPLCQTIARYKDSMDS